LTAEHPAANLYRVEVSGWDDNKAFFVENSELEWTEDSGKHVTLNRGLNNGAVIFLRLLQPISNDRSHPVAYEAELVTQTEDGLRQFRLRPVSARTERKPNCSVRVRKRQDRRSAEMERRPEMAGGLAQTGLPQERAMRRRKGVSESNSPLKTIT
jgi:hypothetical protein